jgi:hypothetical protein
VKSWQSWRWPHLETWAIQVENGFTVSTGHVNVRRTVIVRVDDDTQVIEA